MAGACAVDRGDHELARDQLEIARTWCHQVGDGRLNGLLHRSLAELAPGRAATTTPVARSTSGSTCWPTPAIPSWPARIAAAGIRAEADEADQPAGPAARRPGGAVAGGRKDAAAAGRTGAARPAHALAATVESPGTPPASRRPGRPCAPAEAELSRSWADPDPGLAGGGRGVGGHRLPYWAAYARSARRGGAGGGDDGAAAASSGRPARGQPSPGRPAAAGRPSSAWPAGVGSTSAAPLPAPAAGPGRDRGGRPARPHPGESEVLALVAEGRTNRQIGEALFISEKTASVHVSRLLAKLGASHPRRGRRHRPPLGPPWLARPLIVRGPVTVGLTGRRRGRRPAPGCGCSASGG